MTRIAYLDCVGGIAGDMLVAALVDAGGSIERVRELPGLLELGPVDVRIEPVERQGNQALRMRFDAGEQAGQRTWRAIRGQLEGAALPERVRATALDVFGRLAEAEARIHGVAPEQVHFHELGAIDTLLDVCGVAALLDDLAVDRVASSPLPVGRGLVRAAHGVLPLPAPATVELLRGAPLVGIDIDVELVTPTGAALAASLAESWGPLPPLVLERAGYGAGALDLPDRPNVVRVLIGSAAGTDRLPEVSLLETNLDDFNPELVPDAVERCFAAGALDVWTVPAQMKKGRPGIVLSALARPKDEAAVAAAILEETSALGVRIAGLRRYELEREERIAEVAGGSVRVKLGRLDGKIVNVAPEHDDCAVVAARTGRSVKAVWAEALSAAQSEQ